MNYFSEFVSISIRGCLMKNGNDTAENLLDIDNRVVVAIDCSNLALDNKYQLNFQIGDNGIGIPNDIKIIRKIYNLIFNLHNEDYNITLETTQINDLKIRKYVLLNDRNKITKLENDGFKENQISGTKINFTLSFETNDEIIELLHNINEYINSLKQYFNLPCHIELIYKREELWNTDTSSLFSFHSDNLFYFNTKLHNNDQNEEDCESICENDDLIDNHQELMVSNDEMIIYRGISEISKQYKNKEIKIKCTICSIINEIHELNELKVFIIYEYDIITSLNPIIIDGLKKVKWKNYGIEIHNIENNGIITYSPIIHNSNHFCDFKILILNIHFQPIQLYKQFISQSGMMIIIKESVEMALNDLKYQIPSFICNQVDIKLNMCFDVISNSLHNIFINSENEYFKKRAYACLGCNDEDCGDVLLDCLKNSFLNSIKSNDLNLYDIDDDNYVDDDMDHSVNNFEL